jgi:N-acetyl-gamma-glutamyl-phosphate reductase, common form
MICTMAYRAGVVGASGYTGAELLRLLAGHPEIDAVHVTADSNAGLTVGELFPSLAPAYGAMRLGKLDPADLAGLDVVFLALPHGESQRVAAAVVSEVSHVVDIGADFRLPAEAYEQWYGATHTAPQLLGAFSYGLVELYRPQLAAAKHVANPGCYPTAVSLALAPLLAAGLVEPVGIVADAVSGVSGAGRALKPASLFSEANEDVSAYSLLTHRHTAEMEQALAHVCGGPVSVLFTPHLVPMTRGILATCYARPSGSGLSTTELLELYRDSYADEPFLHVVDEPPHTKATTGSNSVHVTVRFDDRTNTVVAIAAEDNLVKGASGQAIQNANLLLGLPETLGLPAAGMYP